MTFPLTLLFIWLVFWRPQEWLFPWMYGWPVLQLITFVALLGLMMDVNQGRAKFPKTPAVMLSVGLWLSTIMSHVAHTYFQGVLNTYQETFKISVFLLLLLVVLDNIDRLRKVVLLFLLAAILMSIHAIMQFKTGEGFAGSGPIIWWNVEKNKLMTQTQFFGIFGDPNDLGQFLGLAIPFVFAFPRKMTVVALLAAGAVIVYVGEALLTTQSRGTLVGVIAMVACLIFMRLPAKWLPYLVVCGLLGGLGACAFFGNQLLDASAHDRVVFWGIANRYFKSSPINMLFGGGYGMFPEIIGTDNAAHNAFVCCYSELGLLGYWFWFNLLSLGVIGCWRTRVAFRNPRNGMQAFLKRFSGIGIAAIVGFSASSYFLSRAYVYPYFLLFGMLNAVPVIAQRYLPEDHPPLLDFRRDVVINGTIAMLCSIIYIYISVIILNKAYSGG